MTILCAFAILINIFHISKKIKWLLKLDSNQRPCGPSTISTGELNFCVRYGNRCGHLSKATGILDSKVRGVLVYLPASIRETGPAIAG